MDDTNIYFSRIRSIHFVGIKGIAMSALAVWARQKGMRVTGSDIEETFPSDPVLKTAGITPIIGFSASHIESRNKPDLVIYTGAHGGRDNIEVRQAQKLKIPVLPHGKALGIAMREKRQVSVAGSHGKTSTTAMIATILTQAGLDPSYAVGCGEVRGLGLPGHFGSGEFFIAEADEYITDPSHDATPRFLWQRPEILVVTNIDYDHPDAYASLAQVKEAFQKLVKQQTGQKLTIINADDSDSSFLLKQRTKGNIITYGVSSKATFQVDSIRFASGKTMFKLTHDGKTTGEFELKVPGAHNALNAVAAAIACYHAGVPWEDIRSALAHYGGAKRRFEQIGQQNNIVFYDDYAHHPKEISATLEAARLWYPKHRIIVVFQPHTYSRTKSLLGEFGKAFSAGDVIICTDIYASARETDTLGISGQTLVDEVTLHHGHVLYAPDVPAVISALRATCKSGDVVLFIGAGDIYSWERRVYEAIG